MKRILGHVVSLLVCALAVSAAAPACTDNDQSLFIRNALAPAQNRQNGACIYTDDPQQAALFYGDVDLGIRDNYTGVFLVGNQQIPRGDPLAVRAESNRVHLNGGIVRITRPDGALVREFTASATGFADPQNNNAADFGVMGMIVIDAPTAAILRDNLVAEAARLTSLQPANTPPVNVRSLSLQVLANIRVIGRSLGGTDIESAEYTYPINVCVGCRVAFPDGVNDPNNARQPNCLLAPTATTAVSTAPPACVAGQDGEGVSCRNCLDKDICRFF